MSTETDIARIIEQERALVFESFDEDIAFDIGRRARETARAWNKGGTVIGVYLWDRTLFYGATAGGTEGNRRWAERKVQLVKLMMKSSYRVVLERGDKPRVLDNWGLEPGQYAIAGGGFPITLRNFGIVGVAVVSGLHERDDHELVRGAIGGALGKDESYLALPPLS